LVGAAQLVAMRGRRVRDVTGEDYENSFELVAEFRETQGKVRAAACVTKEKCRQFCMVGTLTRAP